MKTLNDLWVVVQRSDPDDDNSPIQNVVPIDHDDRDNCMMVLPTQAEAASMATYQCEMYGLDAFAMPLIEFLAVWTPNL